MFHSLLVLSAALAVPPPDGQWRILKFPLLVEARVIEGEPASKESMGHFDFQIEVRDAKESIRLESTVIAVRDLPDALRILHDTIVWRAPYLFVRVECGGGTAWACNREVVFRVTHDRATQLGSFAVTDERRPALSFRDDYFFDIYDKLESAYIGLCHACLPSFDLVLSDHDGLLQVASDNVDSKRGAIPQDK